jgi:hypothetical protein
METRYVWGSNGYSGHVHYIGIYEAGNTAGVWGDEGVGEHFKDIRVNGRIILKWIFEKWDMGWTGSIWLRTGTGGGLLCMRQRTFGFHRMQGISWVAQELLASQEGLCPMELVSMMLVAVYSHLQH